MAFFGSWMQPGEEFFLKKDAGRYIWRGTSPRVPVNFPPTSVSQPYQVRVYDPYLAGLPDRRRQTADRLQGGRRER